MSSVQINEYQKNYTTDPSSGKKQRITSSKIKPLFIVFLSICLVSFFIVGLTGIISAKENKPDDEVYSVEFVDWDGLVLSSQKVTKGESAITPTSPKRDSFFFIGWEGDYENVTDDIIVVAQYEEITKSIDNDSKIPLVNTDVIILEYPVTPQSVLELAIDEGIPIYSVGRLQIPLVSPDGMNSYVWAISSVVSIVIYLILSIISIGRVVGYIRIKPLDFSEKDPLRSYRFGGTITSISVGLLGTTLFLISSNISGLLVAFDEFAVLNALLLIIGVVGFSFVPSKKNNYLNNRYQAKRNSL